MLSERKRYNYMVRNDGHSKRQKNVQPLKENGYGSTSYESYEQASVQYHKRINQLEKANTKLLDNTAKQFIQFEEDLSKVASILEQKQNINAQIQMENKQLNQDKAILIEALKEKDSIVKQLEIQIKQLYLNKNKQLKQISVKKKENVSVYIQTEQEKQSKQIKLINSVRQDEEKLKSMKQALLYKNKYTSAIDKTKTLEEEIYILKAQLFSTSSQLNLLRQQKSTTKLLQQIQIAKKI